MSLLLNPHDHGQACDCAAHRQQAAAKSGTGLWSTLLPVLACAVCPACLATYTKVLSSLGVGFGLSDFAHVLLLLVAVTASLAISSWRSWRTRRAWPVVVAGTGAMLVLVGHLVDVHAIEWTGVFVLVVGGVTEHLRLGSRRQPALETSH
jgi:hypothetical protein